MIILLAGGKDISLHTSYRITSKVICFHNHNALIKMQFFLSFFLSFYLSFYLDTVIRLKPLYAKANAGKLYAFLVV